MGGSYFPRIVLISIVIVLCFSQETIGRKAMAVDKEDSTVLSKNLERNIVKGRMLIQVMDYSDPEPNPRNARLISPPPPSRKVITYVDDNNSQSEEFQSSMN